MGFLDKIHPELPAFGFTKHDGTIAFYNFVRAAAVNLEAKRVLDFGAGRGERMLSGPRWRREIEDLRYNGAEVWAADLDPIVQSHLASDYQVTLEIGQPLPFDDGFFDLIVSDYTFEHIDSPQFVAAELLRVLRPGGMICARTPNRFGYIKLAASLVPNRHHVGVLHKVQPGRQSQDVFPTVYRMNSLSQIRHLFPGMQVSRVFSNSEPAYYFGNGLLYRAFGLAHKLLPERFATTIFLFIQKN